MEDLILDLLRNPDALLAGLPLEWEKIPPDNRRTLCVCSLHCVLNGPVGVGKLTHFPTIDKELRIKDLVKTTNKSWKGFCFTVALVVKKTNPEIPCSSRKRNGDFWPLADWELKK
jgi:hypothetical protein